MGKSPTISVATAILNQTDCLKREIAFRDKVAVLSDKVKPVSTEHLPLYVHRLRFIEFLTKKYPSTTKLISATDEWSQFMADTTEELKVSPSNITKVEAPELPFKDEGDFFSIKLTKDGKLPDANKLYPFDELQTKSFNSMRSCHQFAKQYGMTAVIA